MSVGWESPTDCEPGDPYLRWQQAAGWQGLLPDAKLDWVPLLLRRAGPRWQTLRSRLPELRLAEQASDALEFATAWWPASRLAELEPQVAAIELSLPSTLGRPPRPHADWPELKLAKSRPVVVGVIDRGGAPLHAAFRDPDDPQRSRLLAYWDQSADASAPWQTAPAGYGRMLAGQALQDELVDGAAAEREAYKFLGLPTLLDGLRDGGLDHATHVLDTLAGLPDGRAAAAAAKPLRRDKAAEAPLVMVSVPAPQRGQSGAAAAMAQVLDALHFVREVARRASPGATVVVNLSLGVQAGPQDGSLLLEQAIDELMRRDRRLLVVMAAGNAAPQPVAAAGRVQGDAELGWRIRPQDSTDSHLELSWLAASEPAAFALELLPPHGLPASPMIVRGQQSRLFDASGRLIALVQLQGARRGLISLAPVLHPTRGGCPAGCWRVRVVDAQSLLLSAQVQGDQALPGQPAAVQSYLDYAQGLRLQHGGLPNAIASGAYPLVVGAARLREGRVAAYTPELPPERLHLLAAADEAAFAPGLVAAGPLSGSWARMGGSSVAAPVAARHWVNLIATSGPLDQASDWRAWLQPPQSAKPMLLSVSWVESSDTTAAAPRPPLMLRPGVPALRRPPDSNLV